MVLGDYSDGKYPTKACFSNLIFELAVQSAINQCCHFDQIILFISIHVLAFGVYAVH